MAFGRDKIKNDLKKAIYKAIAKAYKQNIPFVKEAVDGVNKEHAVNHIIADLEDDNNVAQVPENHIPVDKDNVLHKDIPDVKEMHDAKEAQAKAKLGIMPLAGQKGAINMSEAPSKGVQKLKKFMGDRQMAKTAWHEKGVHHPTPRDNKDSGESLTGHYARKGDSLAHISDYESGKEVANSLHNEKLAEIKKMPKPNLPKSEEMSKGDSNESHKKLKKIINDLTDQQMHIQAQLNHHTLQGTKHPDEKNLKDTYINLNNQKTNLISQLKEAKKPNLPKSEEMSKGDSNKVPLKDYHNILSQHDWYHSYADDIKTRKAGEEKESHLKQIAEQSPEHKQLFENYHRHMFSGPSFGTQRHPKPESLDKAREDELIHPSQRQKFREEKRKMEGRDILQDQVTSSRGVSDVGIEVRRADKRKPGVISHGYARIAEPEFHATRAKKYLQGMHQRIKDMPKPNLPKSEAYTSPTHGKPGTNRDLHSRGVGDVVSVSNDREAQEKSLQGLRVRRGDISGAKDAARETFKESQSMPKPRLGKAEYPRSEHQKIYDAKTQAAQEAYLKTPEGEKQRQIDNQKRIDAQKVKKAESKHDRCVESVEQSSPEVKNPHAVCVARGVTPRKWKK